MVFKSAPALETYLEPWYVEESHFIFDSEGMQLEITPNRHRVDLAPKQPRTLNPKIARSDFAAFLEWRRGPKATDETATLSELAVASAEFADG